MKIVLPIREFKGQFRFLSNFFPATVQWGPWFYPTAEHAYQAAKCVSGEEAAKFVQIVKPGDAKRYGREVQLRPDWESVKLDVMRVVLARKFADVELAARLLATDPRQIVEGNNWGDEFWGFDTRAGRGQNHLGRLLMSLRQVLKGSVLPNPTPRA